MLGREPAGPEGLVVPRVCQGSIHGSLEQEASSNRGICAFSEIQSKRQERKRRSTANPAYSGLLETEVRVLPSLPPGGGGEGEVPGAGLPPQGELEFRGQR